ncbi:hypothetical protein NMY22_g5803 [Coprinellus aureogranulatus]|nr:hypothetical protein NMY22_g5803 [Coprinellus aureogranulatus]
MIAKIHPVPQARAITKPDFRPYGKTMVDLGHLAIVQSVPLSMDCKGSLYYNRRGPGWIERSMGLLDLGVLAVDPVSTASLKLQPTQAPSYRSGGLASNASNFSLALSPTHSSLKRRLRDPFPRIRDGDLKHLGNPQGLRSDDRCFPWDDETRAYLWVARRPSHWSEGFGSLGLTTPFPVLVCNIDKPLPFALWLSSLWLTQTWSKRKPIPSSNDPLCLAHLADPRGCITRPHARAPIAVCHCFASRSSQEDWTPCVGEVVSVDGEFDVSRGWVLGENPRLRALSANPTLPNGSMRTQSNPMFDLTPFVQN